MAKHAPARDQTPMKFTSATPLQTTRERIRSHESFSPIGFSTLVITTQESDNETKFLVKRRRRTNPIEPVLWKITGTLISVNAEHTQVNAAFRLGTASFLALCIIPFWLILISSIGMPLCATLLILLALCQVLYEALVLYRIIRSLKT